ncbi:hypothetical protein ACLBXM_11860 [Xanthobacteraceae bacterium A53D]
MAGRSNYGLKLMASAAFFIFTAAVSAYQLWYAWVSGTVWIGGRHHEGHWESYAQSHGEYWTGVGIWGACLIGSLWLVSMAVWRMFNPRN